MQAPGASYSTRQRVLGDELLRRHLAVHPGPDPVDDARRKDATDERFAGFHSGTTLMFGVDYPHFETIFPGDDGAGRPAPRRNPA